jgi:fused signal recognition particle receptor
MRRHAAASARDRRAIHTTPHPTHHAGICRRRRLLARQTRARAPGKGGGRRRARLRRRQKDAGEAWGRKKRGGEAGGREEGVCAATSAATPATTTPLFSSQVVDELFAYWTLENSEDALEELEEALIAADFGPATALRVVDAVRDAVRAGAARTPADLKLALKASIVATLTPKGSDGEPVSAALNLDATPPAVVMVVGVNGGGKTTTIGKLASRLTASGASVMLAAGDTFRAAAAEQLQGWADRAGVPVADARGATRPDALLFKATQEATKAGVDVLLCDTSGRLHTNDGLMAELAKCGRSLGKAVPGAPHETLLVLDGTTGLNMVNQAKEFNATVPISGIVVTKLDGTAKGGAIVGVVDALRVPVKFVGVGETVADLQPFDAAAFVDALFPGDG